MLPRIRTVALWNYKNIAKCAVDLGALNILIGPNGAGKSNFLDGLRFISDALGATLENALRDRGGIGAVRRRSGGHPTHFGVRLDLDLPGDRFASFAFKVGAEREGAFSVQREECHVKGDMSHDFYVVEDGTLRESSCKIESALDRERLALASISGRAEFRPVYDALRRMMFYNLAPEKIRELQDPDSGQVLLRDGRNLAAMVRELGRTQGGVGLQFINEHLQAIVPGVLGVEHRGIGPKETIEFRQRVLGQKDPWRFFAQSMSDGTLRGAGVLVAMFQGTLLPHHPVGVVGIEEPEMALHPGAADVITECLLLASQQVQILATTHSPEMLNHKGITDEHLIAVMAEEGEAIIGPVDEASRSAIRDRLYMAGELLTMDQLEPDVKRVEESLRQLSLFPGSTE